MPLRGLSAKSYKWCVVCKTDLSGTDTLRMHMERSHNLDVIPGCPECFYYRKRWTDVLKHCESLHAIVLGKDHTPEKSKCRWGLTLFRPVGANKKPCYKDVGEDDICEVPMKGETCTLQQMRVIVKAEAVMPESSPKETPKAGKKRRTVVVAETVAESGASSSSKAPYLQSSGKGKVGTGKGKSSGKTTARAEVVRETWQAQAVEGKKRDLAVVLKRSDDTSVRRRSPRKTSTPRKVIIKERTSEEEADSQPAKVKEETSGVKPSTRGRRNRRTLLEVAADLTPVRQSSRKRGLPESETESDTTTTTDREGDDTLGTSISDFSNLGSQAIDVPILNAAAETDYFLRDGAPGTSTSGETTLVQETESRKPSASTTQASTSSARASTSSMPTLPPVSTVLGRHTRTVETQTEKVMVDLETQTDGDLTDVVVVIPRGQGRVLRL